VPICSKTGLFVFKIWCWQDWWQTDGRTDRKTDERPGRKQTEYKYNITWQATSKASAYRARIAYCKDWNNITCLTERGRSKSENWPERLESKRSWFPLARCERSAALCRLIIHIKFGVDPSTRCWDIAQKTPKCKNFPLTPIVTKISFSPFFRPPGAANPQKGRRHIRNHACKLWRESARGLSRNRWPNKKTEKHTVKQIPCPSL